jgi:flagellar hook-associated protein 1 FlgK
MSLNSSISILGSALRNFQDAVNVTANNLANANTVGYSREVANFSELSPLSIDNLVLGNGASMSSVSRLRDIYLDSQIRTQQMALGFYTQRSTFDQQLSAIVATGGSSLSSLESTLSTAWTNLAGVGSTANKTAVVTAAQALAQQFNQASGQLYALKVNLNQQIQASVDQINTYLDQIATLSLQIKNTTVGSQTYGGLLDAREQVMQSLAQLADFQFNTKGDGSVSVTFDGGALVDGINATHLKTIPSATNPGALAVGFTAMSQSPYTADVSNFIHSGQLGALLQEQNVDLKQAVLSINEMASGLIQRSNEINEAATSIFNSQTALGTQGVAFFTGNEASDIEVNSQVVSNLGNVGATRNGSPVTGDAATLQAAIPTQVLSNEISTAATGFNALGFYVDPNQPMNALNQNFLGAAPVASGTLVISSGGNTINVAWKNTDTLNSIIKTINASGGGHIWATLDNSYNPLFGAASQRILLFGDGPMSVYDGSGNLATSLQLESYLFSSAPINNSPSVGLNAVAAANTLNSAASQLDYYTTPLAPPPQGNPPVPFTQYRAQVNGTGIFTWDTTQSLSTILNNLKTGGGSAGARVTVATFPTVTTPNLTYTFYPQVITLGMPGNFGLNTLGTSSAKPLTFITVNDLTGNFTSFTNFAAPQSYNGIFSSLTTKLSSQSSSDSLFETQAQNAATALQNVQDGIAKVDYNQETALASEYQRAYEASVRVQAVIDQMLDVLINHMGSSTSVSTSVI